MNSTTTATPWDDEIDDQTLGEVCEEIEKKEADRKYKEILDKYDEYRDFSNAVDSMYCAQPYGFGAEIDFQHLNNDFKRLDTMRKEFKIIVQGLRSEAEIEAEMEKLEKDHMDGRAWTEIEEDVIIRRDFLRKQLKIVKLYKPSSSK